MSVRLCMLARDEEANIADVHAACGAMVDDVVVLVDDRTTDDTIGALQLAFGEDAVHAHSFRFDSFGQARNLLFEVAREGLGRGDYLLLADPDSPPRGVLPATLEHDVYDCEWRSGAFTYRLPVLVRADLPGLRYEGACHELLTGWDSGYAPLPGAWVDVHAKPVNRERLAGYLELLERDAATSPRSAFYAAKTLDELDRAPEAIAAFMLRAQMLGWEEETFYCLYRAGVLMRPYDLETARNLLERARRYRPSRIEPVYELARLANDQHRCGDAIELVLAGLALPRSGDSLLVNRWTEREGLREEMMRGVAALTTAVAGATVNA